MSICVRQATDALRVSLCGALDTARSTPHRFPLTARSRSSAMIRSFYRSAILTLVLVASAVTYEEPPLRAQSTPPNCTGSTPSSAPCGRPTARCNDGTYSCSQNRSGTCSSHNGVACWICPGPLCGIDPRPAPNSNITNRYGWSVTRDGRRWCFGAPGGSRDPRHEPHEHRSDGDARTSHEIGGAASVPLFDNGTNGDAVAGDRVFSRTVTVSAATSAGGKSLPVTVADAQGGPHRRASRSRSPWSSRPRRRRRS